MFKQNTLLILFILLALGLTDSVQAQERKAIITYIEGEVNVLRPGEIQWTKAKIKMNLEVGYKLKTALASLCEITFEDGSTVTVKENTTIDLKELLEQEGIKKTRFKLWIGKIKVRIEKLRKGSYFQVETPTGIVGARGTIWTVEYDEETGITTVSVEEGKVYVRGIEQREEEEVIVREGESANIYPKEKGAFLPSIPTIPGFTVLARLSPEPEFGWHNEPPKLTFIITAKAALPDTPLIITVNEVEKARLFGGPTYAHSVTDLYFVNQGRNDLVSSCGFLGGENVPMTIPVYFDNIAPIITDPSIDFPTRRLSVRIHGERGEEASGVRRVTANGAEMSVVVQDEEYEMIGLDFSRPILVEAWDKAGIAGNKAELIIDPKYFDLNPPVIGVLDFEFEFDQGWRLKIEIDVTDLESGVREVRLDGVPMARSGNRYTAVIGGPFFGGRVIKIEATDNVGKSETREVNLSSSIVPPPPQP